MLSTLWKQMEDQQTEMIRLRVAAAREKDAATRVQTRLLKQIGTVRKSQFSPTTEGNARTPLSPPRTRESKRFTGSSRRNQSTTYNDEDSEDSDTSQGQQSKAMFIAIHPDGPQNTLTN